ncbi:DUF3047 domain-containing protein [Puniceibacterium sp. IMCC21224]|uniref:DUF3047 domain-containing protein n=1 Tax=Puniceibacterium sp. IMCC21224 TaxID=1618204 RepID=UPI00064DA8A4|nr:DUF3047 domain-containing protein [Puniceibacterium sp. IMCC21224]KMK66239.1 Protein of unknown function (DUF3047) [Puniceibacterium sp. IMCC21224]
MFRFSSLAIACALTTALPAEAASVGFDGDWKQQKFSLFSQNRYGFRGNTLTVASDGAVSLAYKALPEALWPAKSARWSWSVTEGVPPTDLRKKGGDDRNLALYFVFLPADQAQAFKGASVRKLMGADAARVLVYVWGGAAQRGAVLDSPYLGARGKTVVLRTAGTGHSAESVDLARDYGRAFGGVPGALVGLAVSGDSDDTDSTIRASVSGLQVN